VLPSSVLRREDRVESNDLNPHLSQIETHWSAVFRAHQNGTDEANLALAALVHRYGGAIHRYLLASLRDVDAADELSQEFALRFLRGDFRSANPDKGRFRDFLKRAVYHLMVDYHRKRRAQDLRIGEDGNEPVAPMGDPWETDLDRQFLMSWRDQLLARAWAAVDRVQARTGQPFADVLRLRVDSPDLSSAELAERLSDRQGCAVNAGWVRLNLHRARDIFVKTLIDEVKRSLNKKDSPSLDEELSDLGLLEYCRSTLKRRRQAPFA
jgi:DNA-directed RNA polymerase specialized sigma24 family protein